PRPPTDRVDQVGMRGGVSVDVRKARRRIAVIQASSSQQLLVLRGQLLQRRGNGGVLLGLRAGDGLVSLVENGLDELEYVHGVAFVVHSIRSASRSGSMTPFCSLDFSKPFSDSAWIVTCTLPARSARLAMAFQAVNRPFRSVVKLISTVLSVASFAAGPVPPGTVPPIAVVVPPVVPTPAAPDSPPPGTTTAGPVPTAGAASGIACGSIRKPDSRSISSSATVVLKRTLATVTWNF